MHREVESNDGDVLHESLPQHTRARISRTGDAWLARAVMPGEGTLGALSSAHHVHLVGTRGVVSELTPLDRVRRSAPKKRWPTVIAAIDDRSRRVVLRTLAPLQEQRPRGRQGQLAWHSKPTL